MEGQKPSVHQHYALYFNSVDKFNKLMAYISFLPRCANEEMRILTGLIEILIVEIWVVVNDWRSDITEANEREFLYEFAIELAKSLC